MTSVKAYFDIRRPLTSGLYPVRIRVTHDLKSRFYPTKYSLPKPSPRDKVSEFDRIMSGKNLSVDQKGIYDKLTGLEKKASVIIDDLEFFSFEEFEKRFFNTGDKSDLIHLLIEKSEDFRQNEKFSSANLYKQTADILQKYIGQKKFGDEKRDHSLEKLPVKTLTPGLLKDFQKWALKANYSVTTVSMYLVRVKAILNSPDLAKGMNPFGKESDGKFPLPKPKGNKRPLIQGEIMLLYNYQTEIANEIFSRDMFIFSYLANGMNLYDVFKLRWCDVKDDQFNFVRQKTRAKQPDKLISVAMSEDIKAIIARHGSHKIDKNGYIFNILKHGMTAAEEHKRIRTAISVINASLKRIAGKLGITSEISTYYARHSYATILRDLDVSLDYISQQLGHADLHTTQSYLDKYKIEKVIEHQSKLLNKG